MNTAKCLAQATHPSAETHVYSQPTCVNCAPALPWGPQLRQPSVLCYGATGPGAEGWHTVLPSLPSFWPHIERHDLTWALLPGLVAGAAAGAGAASFCSSWRPRLASSFLMLIMMAEWFS